MCILSMDYGKECTGIAVTDPLQIIASGLAIVSTSTLFDHLKDYVAHGEVERIIIGKPMQTNSKPSESMTQVERLVNRWRKAIPQIPIEYRDERLTSVLTHKAILASGIGKKAW